MFMQIGFAYTVRLGDVTLFAVRLRIFAPSLEKFYALVRKQEFPNLGSKKRCLEQLHKYTERFLKNMLYVHSITTQLTQRPRICHQVFTLHKSYLSRCYSQCYECEEATCLLTPLHASSHRIKTNQISVSALTPCWL